MVQTESRIAIRDMHGKIELVDIGAEEPWIRVHDKFVVDFVEGRNYVLPLGTPSKNTLAVAQANGVVVLVNLENRETGSITQGKCQTQRCDHID